MYTAVPAICGTPERRRASGGIACVSAGLHDLLPSERESLLTTSISPSLRCFDCFPLILGTRGLSRVALVPRFIDMLEDKYIGIVLAFSGSVAIGTSFIITKKVRKAKED